MTSLTIRVDGKDELTLQVTDGKSIEKAIEQWLVKERCYDWCTVDYDGPADFTRLPLYRYQWGFGAGSIVVLRGYEQAVQAEAKPPVVRC